MVSVRKRGKVYEYRIEIASIDGTRKWLTKSGFKTKQEALHARAHEKHKKDFMQRYGIDNIPINKPVRILMERILSNKPFGVA